MAVLGIALYYAGISLGWLYNCCGILVASAVLPSKFLTDFIILVKQIHSSLDLYFQLHSQSCRRKLTSGLVSLVSSHVLPFESASESSNCSRISLISRSLGMLPRNNGMARLSFRTQRRICHYRHHSTGLPNADRKRHLSRTLNHHLPHRHLHLARKLLVR